MKLNQSNGEGYIKFQVFLKENIHALDDYSLDDLILYRKKLMDLKLIGMKGNVGYGNISKRVDEKRFIISATKTGDIYEATKQDFTLVTFADIDNNIVYCEGLKKASSETMTHAAIYYANDHIKYVIHIHSIELWKHYYNMLPFTSEKAQYGTVEIAKEIYHVVKNIKSNKGIVLLKGHEEGLISFAETIEEAFSIIIDLIKKKGEKND
ncbi:MAG: class II aldolase/adducin family protein [Candidatus Woesearchaeota archaeon]